MQLIFLEEELLEKEKKEKERKKKKMRKKIPLPTQTLTTTPSITPIASNVITSLDETSVTTPNNDWIKREGNTIIRHGSHG